VVEGGGQNENTNDLSIVVNTSAINEIKSENEFKFGFSLADLYKVGLEFYKKGK